MYCQKIKSFSKDSGTGHLNSHLKKAHPPNQSQQIQISTYGCNIEIFKYRKR